MTNEEALDIIGTLDPDIAAHARDGKIGMNFGPVEFVILCGIMNGITSGEVSTHGVLHSIKEFTGTSIPLDEINRVLTLFPH